MGGFGSGRYSHLCTRRTCEGTYQLHIGELWQFHLCLGPGSILDKRWTDCCLTITVTPAGYRLCWRHPWNGEATEDDVRLDYTPCHLGGRRPWFRCPRCGRRVGVLYGAGRRFLCRHCYNLIYQSQRNDREERLRWRLRKLHARLGGNQDEYTFPDKPKGMHWSTYSRNWRKSDALNQQFNTAQTLALMRFRPLLERLEQWGRSDWR